MENERPSFDGVGEGKGLSTGNPWWGFAHPGHRDEELEPLVRTLRFASIQLNKFWVELNAFPVFMNEMKGASLKQIERLFDWFQAAPSWSAKVTLPRLVPELCQDASRQALLRFTERVVRARLTRAWLAERLTAPLANEAELATAIERLEQAVAISGKQGLTAGGLAEVDARIRELGLRLERNGRLQTFFSRLANECALGAEATQTREAGRVFQAVDLARRTPATVWAWRRPQILAAHNRAKIQGWQERSAPLLEARSRLEPVFRMEERVAAAQLRLLAEKLERAGMFRMFSSEYKDAVARYRDLLKVENGPAGAKRIPQETREAMSAKLVDWADYLERKAQIEESGEAKALFAPNFRGIDTQFAAALEANAWAESVRGELESEDKGAEADFCSRLLDALFSAPSEKLAQAVEACGTASTQAIQAILVEPDYASAREFSAIGCDDEARWIEATRLKECIAGVGLRAYVRLSDLGDIQAACRDLLAALEAIAGAGEAKAAFKSSFLGERTDLSLLESAQDYIDFVRGAELLSETLKASFLTAHGPQRLQDTRVLVAPALSGLAQVKEHFRKLDLATHGQSRQLEELPLLDLLQRIQQALKVPTLLADSVCQLQRSS